MASDLSTLERILEEDITNLRRQASPNFPSSSASGRAVRLQQPSRGAFGSPSVSAMKTSAQRCSSNIGNSHSILSFNSPEATVSAVIDIIGADGRGDMEAIRTPHPDPLSIPMVPVLSNECQKDQVAPLLITTFNGSNDSHKNHPQREVMDDTPSLPTPLSPCSQHQNPAVADRVTSLSISMQGIVESQDV